MVSSLSPSYLAKAADPKVNFLDNRLQFDLGDQDNPGNIAMLELDVRQNPTVAIVNNLLLHRLVTGS